MTSNPARRLSRSVPFQPRTRRLGALIGVSLLSLVLATPAWAGPDGPTGTALPTGGEVVAGQISIGTSGSAMTITQSTQRGIINWQGFDIGSDASVQFVQPDTTSVTLNRVLGGNGSTIAGKLSANGKVYVVNPNGVLFTSTAQVDVGGLVAAAGDIADSDFLAGRNSFTISPTASVINQGSLTARGGGAVVLVGGSVSNLGAISATRGDVVLAAGSKVTLDAGADGHLKVEVDGATSQALVQNGGLIAANGGQVLLTAQGASAAVSSVVSNTGTIEARTLSNQSGRILLLAGMLGGTVQAGGTLDASAPDGGDGGFVETSAANLDFGSDLRVDTTAPNGVTGNWLIDPTNVVISDNVNDGGVGNLLIDNQQLSSWLENSNITLATVSPSESETGNITFLAPVMWSAATTLTINADAATGGVYIKAVIIGSNANSSLVLSAGAGGINQSISGTITIGTLTANAGNGGGVTLNATNNQIARLGISSAGAGFALSNGTALVVNGTVTSGSGLVSFVTGGNLTVNAALSSSVSNAIFRFQSPVGTVTFTKDVTLTGSNAALILAAANGYALTNGARLTLSGLSSSLTINADAYTVIHNAAQLQAIASGGGYYALGNDIDALATSGWNSGTGFDPVAGFTGTFAGLGHAIDGLTINRASTTQVGLFGSTTGATLRDFTLSNISVAGAARVGAVVGNADSTTLSNVHVTGSVNGFQEVGGIAGWFTDSSLSGVYSAASVTAAQDTAGGLIGRAYFTTSIVNSYAVGPVTGQTIVGGLIGDIANGGTTTLTNVYASGKVTGNSLTGGLVGQWGTGGFGFSGAYWDAGSTGQSTSGRGFGIGFVNGIAYTQATYSGFDFTNTWVILPGDTRPMLRNEASSVIFTPHALQLMSLNPAASYTLGANIDLTSAFTLNGGYYGDVWSSAGFKPVGDTGTQFSGRFDGRNHSITGLTINRGSTSYIGLFGYVIGATISNVRLVGGSVTGRNYVGALAGTMYNSNVSNVSASTTVTGTFTSETKVGGLIGSASGGSITLSSASGTVTGAGSYVGGLIGFLVNGGTISQSYATGSVTGTSTANGFGYIGGLAGANGDFLGNGGTISQSYATGAVSGSSGPIGGFVGQNDGAITDSYATGNVTGTSGAAINLGGFVGMNYTDGTITNAYSTGYVSGGTSQGGFVGYNAAAAGAITNAYWNTQTSGLSVATSGGSASGMTGRTTAQLQASLPAGFSSTIWRTGSGLYPYLSWRYSTAPVAISGTAYVAPGGSTLAGAAVAALSNGGLIGSTGSGANGYYYILSDAGSIGSSGAIVYLDGGATRGATFSDAVSANGIPNLALYGGMWSVLTDDASLTATRADYLTALGSYTDSDLSFITGSGLSTATGYGIRLAAYGTYLLDADIGSGERLLLSAPGSFGVSGAVALTANGTLQMGGASWSDASSLALTTSAGNSIALLGAINAGAGTLTLSSGGTIADNFDLSVNSFKLLSGGWSQIGTLPNFSAVDFQLTANAAFIRALAGNGTAGNAYQLADVYGLQGMASPSLIGQNFVLANDIEASGTAAWNGGAGFVPVGSNLNAFTGSFDGQGHAITGLHINRAGSAFVGLFAYSSGTIRNLSISGQFTGASHVGGLIGVMTGGSVTGIRSAVTIDAATNGIAGGLVGSQSGGTISLSSASGTVSGTYRVGGLVGEQVGGAINQSFATGSVSATGGNAGGLVGVAGFGATGGSISNSYATGSVSGPTQVGGLVGYLGPVASISNSYASGQVSGTILVGGLVGVRSGSVTASFWNTASSGQAGGAGSGSNTGITGVNATGMNLLSTFAAAGWDIDDTGGTGKIWRIYDGQTAPLLRGFLTPLTVTGGSVSQTYSGSAASGAGTLTYSFTPNAGQLFGTAGYVATSANAGTYGGADLQLAGLYSTQAGYDIIATPGNLTILPATLIVAVKPGTKVYDGAAWSGGNGVSYTGFVNNEDTSVLGGALIYGGNSQGAANFGTYVLSASGLTSSNYAINYVSNTLNISKAPLSVAVNNVTSIYTGVGYGGGSGVTYTGFVPGDNVSVLAGTLTYGGAAQGAVNAGNYTLTASGLSSGNYAITYVSGALTINPAPLVITASNATKTYDGLAYSGGNGVSYNGFVNGEGSGVLGGTLAYGGAAQGAINAGSYGLSASGLTSGNYAISYVSGALVVNPAALTVTVNGATKTYDGLSYSGGNGVSYNGFVNGEGASALGGTLIYGGTAQGAINAGSYGLSASGLSSGNYVISYVNGALVVNPAALTVTVNGATKTYDGLAYSGGNGVSYNGFVNGEGSGVLGGALVYGGAAQGAINAGSYGLSASGLSSGNYTISYVNGALVVNPAALTVTVNGATRTYDGLAYSGGNGVSYNGFVNGEGASALGGTLVYGSAAQGAINAGTYSLAASGLTSGNYVIRYVAGNLVITPARLTVTANPLSVPAFSSLPALTYTLAGLAQRDAATGVLTGALATSTALDRPGTYAITQGSLVVSNPNYVLSQFVPGVLTVTVPMDLGAPDGGFFRSGLANATGEGADQAMPASEPLPRAPAAPPSTDQKPAGGHLGFAPDFIR